MPAAIKRVFPNTIHRLCLWHVINKFQPLLNELYAMFEKWHFKEKFQSVVHHPLTPSEFEAAWSMLLNEFELEADPTLQSLYDIHHDWVPCFFKDDYCGIMSSTQRSESVNYIVKKCHVDANTPLHLFAKQMMKFIHRRKMDEVRETYGCTVCVNFCAYVTMHLVLCFYAHYVTILNCIVKSFYASYVTVFIHPPVCMFLCTLCCKFFELHCETFYVSFILHTV